MPHTTHKISFTKGFNLIEAAIVLGVVGLVIGGIWVAASSVNDNRKITRTISAVLEIYAKSQALFPYGNYAEADANAGNWKDFTSTLLVAGAPGDMISNGQAINPFGTAWVVSLTGSSFSHLPGESIAITLYTIPQAACIKIIQHFMGLRGPNKGGFLGSWSSTYSGNSGWWLSSSTINNTWTLTDIRDTACNAPTVTFNLAFSPR